MTPAQKKQLDGLYQQIKLRREPFSILSHQKASVSHHFLQGRNLSIRWWFPVGVSLAAGEHGQIHNDPRAGEMKQEIINIKGQDWFKKVQARKWIVVTKEIKYQTVLDYFSGKVEDYI